MQEDGRREGFIGRVRSHAKNGQPEPFAQNWAVVTRRSVGEQNCFFGQMDGRTAEFHSCRARRGVDRSRPPTRNTQTTRTNDCRQLFSLSLRASRSPPPSIRVGAVRAYIKIRILSAPVTAAAAATGWCVTPRRRRRSLGREGRVAAILCPPLRAAADRF